jgi:hypothetical protein
MGVKKSETTTNFGDEQISCNELSCSVDAESSRLKKQKEKKNH